MQRVKELDSIRGLAALAIVVYHLWFLEIGLLGSAVDLFFVLSGYLITSILISHPISPGMLGSFYARRGLRIWPIYYLSLAALVAFDRLTDRAGPLDGLPWYATFLQNVSYTWSDSAPPFLPAFRHTWSLAIEEQFYLVWPALLRAFGRRAIPWLSAAFIGLAIAARGLGFNAWILATHCDGLALGALLAWVSARPDGASPVAPRRLPFGAIALAAGGFWLGAAVLLKLTHSAWGAGGVAVVQSLRLFSLNLAYCALVGLIASHAGSPRLGILRHGSLVYLGQISYGLYLYHHIVFMLWDEQGWPQGIGPDLVKAALAFAVAGLSWRYIERPILRLKDWFSYRPRPASAGRAPAPELLGAPAGLAS